MALTFESYMKLDGLFQVKVFIQPHYLQNFVQATFNALGADRVKGMEFYIFHFWMKSSTFLACNGIVDKYILF